jgi:hypothetical protein
LPFLIIIIAAIIAATTSGIATGATSFAKLVVTFIAPPDFLKLFFAGAKISLAINLSYSL